MDKISVGKFKVVKVVAAPITVIKLENKVNDISNIMKIKQTSLLNANSKEMMIKSNLVRDLNNELQKCGVVFDNSLLKVVNRFFKDTQDYFDEKIISLEATNTQLYNELQLAKEHQCELKPNNRNDLLNDIKHLGTQFLSDIETLFIKDERKNGFHHQIKSDNATTETQLPANHTCKTIADETPSVIVSELMTRIQNTDEVAKYKKELNELFLNLLQLFNDNFLNDDAVINMLEMENLPINGGKSMELDGRSALIADPIMGYQLEVPIIDQRHMTLTPGKQMFEHQQNGNTDTGASSKKRSYVLDFNNYLHECSVPINSTGDRPLHRDVLNNNLLEVKRQCVVLKLQKISVDILNNEYCTPLHLAVMNDADSDIVTTLLHYGAKFEKPDGQGNTLLHIAVENNTIAKLLKCVANDQIVHRIINVYNHEGYTALHLAAIQGKAGELVQLIKYKANLDICDKKSGRTALYHAIEGNHVEVVQILMKHDANPHMRTYGGTSIVEALYEAESNFSPEMKKLFYDDRMAIATERKAEKRTTANKPHGSKRQRKK